MVDRPTEKIIVNGVDTNNTKLVFPRKKDKENIVSIHTNARQIFGLQHKFYGALRDYYNNENSKFNPDALPNLLIVRSLFYNALLTYWYSIGLYQTKTNILVIPNWKEDEEVALYDVENTTSNYDPSNASHNYAPHSILSACFWILWKRHLGSHFSITVALPSEYSLLKHLYRTFDINVIECSKHYSLGEDTYSGFTLLNPPHKFDVVQLLGHDRPEEGTVFRAEDIKDDFKRYCNDDFLLHDMWRPTFNLKDGLTKTWNNNWYRGIEGTPNEEAMQSLKEFKSYQQSMDWGFVLDNNNDSDASKIMEEGFCVSNPYLMHSDSDISNPTMISARDRKAQITIEKYGLDSSTNVNDLINDKQHHAGFSEMFREASRMAFERNKSQQFIPIF